VTYCKNYPATRQAIYAYCPLWCICVTTVATEKQKMSSMCIVEMHVTDNNKKLPSVAMGVMYVLLSHTSLSIIKKNWPAFMEMQKLHPL